jgi:hypothetical protein
MISAQDLTRTRICAAHHCELDAEPGHEFCWRCARKPNIRRHEAPEVYTGPTLRCCSHERYFPGQNAFLPDEAFSHGKKIERRGRNQECRKCSKQRRILQRALMTPEEHAAECARQAERRLKARASWTPEQLAARRAKGRAYDQARRTARTPEETEALNAARREARALMTPKQRARESENHFRTQRRAELDAIRETYA